MESKGCYEPKFTFIYADRYQAMTFGIFISYVVILAMLTNNSDIQTSSLIIYPLVSGLVSAILSPISRALAKITVLFLDFPVMFIEAVLFVRLVNFISRSFYTVNKTNGRYNKYAVYPISFVALTYGFTLILNGLVPKELSILHGLSFSLLISAFIYTLVANNGILTDPSLIFFRTMLSIAPCISYSSGFNTVILRLACVLSSLASFLLIKDRSTTASFFLKVFPHTPLQKAMLVFALVLLSYTFMSTSCFINPDKFRASIGSVFLPVAFLVSLLNESFYFHIHETPRVR